MKPTIHILPENLCNKIAAGEVVERPSSVVKELVENSLDAGATSITVELESGGKRLIRVMDNGCGMNRQDAFLSFERHATSKIMTDTDLFSLTTLGFRGEALASIASVSRLHLSTCDNQDGLGHQIYAEGGKIKRAEEAGLPRGTVVEVRNLFFNLPARKKFLRKDQTELGHAADVVTKQALAHPHVSFHLKHNERTLLELRRGKDIRERISALLGRSLLNDMLPVNCTGELGLKVSGYISQPQLNRSATSHVYTFVNGRYIKDRVVQHAVMEGYRHLLMKGRYPVVILFLEMDPEQVDVNVHPTKHEVRFRDQAQVHDYITGCLKSALRPADWVTKSDPNDRLEEGSAPSVEQHGGAPASDISPYASEPSSDAPPLSKSYGRVPLSQDYRFRTFPESSGRVEEKEQEVQYRLPGSQAGGFFAQLQILGQYHQSYILCQDGDDLILIDQHAAHERVGFEALRRSYSDGDIPSQALLFPEILDLDYNSSAALQENLPELNRLGFDVEPFGGNSFALKAVPQLLSQTSTSRLLVDVALELERIGRTGQLRDSIDDILILMACHSVIRANQALTTTEIKALFQEMDDIDFKANCPHGRPVLQRLTLAEVERLFRRQ